MTLNIETIRNDFPTLRREVRPDVPLVYLDSGATALMSQPVMDAMRNFETQHRANIHRGVHTLAEEATALYETARKSIGELIGAPDTREVIFTGGTTHSINLVANSWGRANLTTGDTILLTEMEHHANLVPWQMLAAQMALNLEFIPVCEDKTLDLDVFHSLLEQKRPKLVALVHVSNVLGTLNPVAEIVTAAHAVGAVVLVDGAQAVPHMPVDVRALDVDFYAFSGHKMTGPTGIGILYGKAALLEAMPPFFGGGDMIKSVALRSYKANDLPFKFEAGTPPIAEAIGLGEAARYLRRIGPEAISSHSRQLTDAAITALQTIPGVHLFGPGLGRHTASVSFTVDGLHPHDVSQVLDTVGVAVRAGHHCAMPLHTRFQLPATTRASFYLYNQVNDVEILARGIREAIALFG